MNKRFGIGLALAIALTAALIASVVPASPVFSQSEQAERVYVLPWRPPHEGVVRIEEDQILVLGVRWGACTRGLAQAWTKQANVTYEIYGTDYYADADSRDGQGYWTRPVAEPRSENAQAACLAAGDSTWMVYWWYEFGALAPGEYEGRLYYGTDHPFIDGGDYDRDGSPDKFLGLLWEPYYPFTIIVE